MERGEWNSLDLFSNNKSYAYNTHHVREAFARANHELEHAYQTIDHLLSLSAATSESAASTAAAAAAAATATPTVQKTAAVPNPYPGLTQRPNQRPNQHPLGPDSSEPMPRFRPRELDFGHRSSPGGAERNSLSASMIVHVSNPQPQHRPAAFQAARVAAFRAGDGFVHTAVSKVKTSFSRTIAWKRGLMTLLEKEPANEAGLQRIKTNLHENLDATSVLIRELKSINADVRAGKIACSPHAHWRLQQEIDKVSNNLAAVQKKVGVALALERVRNKREGITGRGVEEMGRNVGKVQLQVQEKNADRESGTVAPGKRGGNRDWTADVFVQAIQREIEDSRREAQRELDYIGDPNRETSDDEGDHEGEDDDVPGLEPDLMTLDAELQDVSDWEEDRMETDEVEAGEGDMTQEENRAMSPGSMSGWDVVDSDSNSSSSAGAGVHAAETQRSCVTM
ncbi:hypothetical protein B0T16DRAFT_388349 [Cercophora newfieldiana]|uniref:Uncharacterized protein n=1 Tax=Cercophora newfieldiana TaxID=92897 RepID=A0AA39Y8K7_9PEZI|nr:hypothetical protein B0T16DRAFT_388349 [Cercophora newfieldiana]